MAVTWTDKGSIKGSDGSKWLNGVIDPAPGQGADGDYFLNTASGDVFGPKAGGAWPPVAAGNIKGPQGAGAKIMGSDTSAAIKVKTGPDAVAGNIWVATDTGTSGGGFPDTSPGDGLLASGTGTWTNIGPIRGPAGAIGPAGATWHSGITVPKPSDGVDGDFFIDTVAGRAYGPKATTWGAGFSLVGAAGVGAAWSTGAVDPLSGVGAVGDMYLNTATGAIFGPKTGTGWTPSVVTAKGADGKAGTVWTVGAVVPGASSGALGDHFLKDDGVVYVKGAAAWAPAAPAVNLKGADGAPGSKWFVGNTAGVAPTALPTAVAGDLFLDMDSGKVFSAA